MNSNYIKLVHLNIRSLLPKLNEIKLFLRDENIDILALTETWLTDGVSSADAHIAGYELIRADRGSRGGGVCFYFRDNLKYKVLNSSRAIEQLWLMFTLSGTSFIVGTVYRPPKFSAETFIDELENSFAACIPFSDRVICIGDFNIDLLGSGGREYTLLTSLLESVGATQVICEPTRTTDHTVKLIDHIVTLEPALIRDSGVIPCQLSDHDAVFCNLNCTKVPPKSVYKVFRNLSEINYDDFSYCLRQIPFNHIYFINDINDKLDFFNNNLLSLFDIFAPIKKRKLRSQSPPWLTDNLKLMISLRDKAKEKYRQDGLPSQWEYYKSLRNLTNFTVKAEKRAYFKYVSGVKDKRVMWKKLHSLNVQRATQPPIPESLKKVDELNQYYIDSVNEIVNSLKINNAVVNNVDAQSPVSCLFEFETVDVALVGSLIRGLSSSSEGSDSISADMIKLCCPVILPYMTHIINFCIAGGLFPDCWKNAIVKPIPKVTNPTQFKELRPISILPTFSKILEKVLKMQLVTFLEKTKLLPSTQSGFRKGYSCVTSMLAVTDDIIGAYDKGSVSVLVLLDFSRAFDTVNHGSLCNILSGAGLGATSVGLIKNYLSDRTQVVKIDDSVSVRRLLTSGVPQGSILGPILFSAYTSHLYDVVKSCQTYIYADDTQLLHTFPHTSLMTAINLINSDLNGLTLAARDLCLKINPNKSEVMLFGNKRLIPNLLNNINICVDGKRLPIVDSAKTLGLVLDNSFRYTDQVTRYIKNAYAALRLLYPHRSYLTYETKRILCEALVLSQFNYMLPLYHPALSAYDSNRIQKVQNCCLRYIYGLRKYDHISHKLQSAGWLSMKNRAQLNALVLYHKLLFYETPPYLFNRIHFRDSIHDRVTRYRHFISPPLHRTSLFKRSFSYHIYKSYNYISSSLKRLAPFSFRVRVFQSMFNSQCRQLDSGVPLQHCVAHITV